MIKEMKKLTSMAAGMKPPKPSKVSPAHVMAQKFMKMKGKNGVGSGLLSGTVSTLRNRSNIIGRAIK